MKTASTQARKESEATRKVIRKIFELQLELEQLNKEPHDYLESFQRIIESVDNLFESVMQN